MHINEIPGAAPRRFKTNSKAFFGKCILPVAGKSEKCDPSALFRPFNFLHTHWAGLPI